MRKNTQAVYKAWKNGQRKNGASISTDGQEILSYSTPILRHGVGTPPALNVAKYSATTSRHQGDLRALMLMDNIEYIEVDGRV